MNQTSKPLSPGMRKLIKKLCAYTVAQNGGVIDLQRIKCTFAPEDER